MHLTCAIPRPRGLACLMCSRLCCFSSHPTVADWPCGTESSHFPAGVPAHSEHLLSVNVHEYGLVHLTLYTGSCETCSVGVGFPLWRGVQCALRQKAVLTCSRCMAQADTPSIRLPCKMAPCQHLRHLTVVLRTAHVCRLVETQLQCYIREN